MIVDGIGRLVGVDLEQGTLQVTYEWDEGKGEICLMSVDESTELLFRNTPAKHGQRVPHLPAILDELSPSYAIHAVGGEVDRMITNSRGDTIPCIPHPKRIDILRPVSD